MRNANFAKVSWLYASNGFCKPILSSKTPDGTQIGFNIMELTNYFDYVNNSSDAVFYHDEMMDLYNQYMNPDSHVDVMRGILHFKFIFDKSAIRSLRLLPFLSFSEDKTLTGINAFENQRETSGTFYIYRIDKGLRNVYKLTLEIANNATIKYKVGESTSVHVDTASGRGNFHCHPLNAYKLYNVIIGTPSSPDIKNFVKDVIYDINLKEPVIKFHAVIALEGIYIISLSKNGINFIKEHIIQLSQLYDHYFNYFDDYEYNVDNRKYDWSKYDFHGVNEMDEADKTRVSIEVARYLTWFKGHDEQKFVGGGLFNMQFFSWKQLGDNDTIIDIDFYSNHLVSGALLYQ